MRRRPPPESPAAEVTRRRLEALSRELGLAGATDRDDVEPGIEGVAPEPPGRGGPGRGGPGRGGLGRGGPGPGRHALPRSSWRERVGLRPAPWLVRRQPGGGSRQFGSAHLAVVALVVSVSLAVGAWHTLRVAAEPTEVPVSPPTLAEPDPTSVGAEGLPSDAPTGSTTGPTTSAAPDIVVDVVGRVRKPGIAVLDAGSRVVDALRAAGGVRNGARPSGLNLARPLVDGEQIVVGRAGVPPAASAAPSVAGSTLGAPVNLNTADAAALDTLPGVGPVTAAAILEWREQHGGFTAVEELLEVSGIGEATLAEIAPHVTL